MESSYQLKSQNQDPRMRRSFSYSSGSSGNNSSFTSSNNSIMSNNSCQKTNCASKNSDLLPSDDDNNNSSGTSCDEMDMSLNDAKPERHLKSFVSIIKFLRNISAKKSNNQALNRSILRRPTEYCFVKGISGLPMRVRASSTTSCHRCIAKH